MAQGAAQRLFGHNALALSVPGKANQILFAAGEGNQLEAQLTELKPLALTLQLQSRVEFSQLLRRLQQENRKRWLGLFG